MNESEFLPILNGLPEVRELAADRSRWKRRARVNTDRAWQWRKSQRSMVGVWLGEPATAEARLAAATAALAKAECIIVNLRCGRDEAEREQRTATAALGEERAKSAELAGALVDSCVRLEIELGEAHRQAAEWKDSAETMTNVYTASKVYHAEVIANQDGTCRKLATQVQSMRSALVAVQRYAERDWLTAEGRLREIVRIASTAMAEPIGEVPT
jgi:hypothetical protein